MLGPSLRMKVNDSTLSSPLPPPTGCYREYLCKLKLADGGCTATEYRGTESSLGGFNHLNIRSQCRWQFVPVLYGPLYGGCPNRRYAPDTIILETKSEVKVTVTKMVCDTPPQDASTHQIWKSYLMHQLVSHTGHYANRAFRTDCGITII